MLQLDFYDTYRSYSDMSLQKTEFALDDDEKDIIRLFRSLSRKEKHEFMSKAYTYESTMMSRKDIE